jgi:molecular chaperone DnaK (HSP70)
MRSVRSQAFDRFSGIAFAHSSRPKDIQTISNWVEGSNTDRGKCPTLLTYNEDGSQVTSWAYGAVRDPNAVKWFKLLLLRPEDLSTDVRECEEFRDAEAKMHALKKEPVNLVADYLKKLWGLTQVKMAKAYGQLILDHSQFHVVLSVPAIWPDYAKDSMLNAARLAGICDDRPSCHTGATRLDLISEPEAAALATMMDNFADKLTSDGAAIAQVCEHYHPIKVY